MFAPEIEVVEESEGGIDDSDSGGEGSGGEGSGG